MRELEEGGQKVQTSSYKTSTGHVIYSMMSIVNNDIWYI